MKIPHSRLTKMVGCAAVVVGSFTVVPAWAVPVTYQITGDFTYNRTPASFLAVLTFDEDTPPAETRDFFGSIVDWNLSSASVTFKGYSQPFNTSYAVYQQDETQFSTESFFAFGPYSDQTTLIEMQPIFTGAGTADVSGVLVDGSVFSDDHSNAYPLSNVTLTVVSAVPEPASLALFGLGAAGLLAFRQVPRRQPPPSCCRFISDFEVSQKQ